LLSLRQRLYQRFYSKKGLVMFKLKWLTALMWLPIAASPSFAADPAPVVGTWKLVSFEREYQASSERETPMGKVPAGYIMFLPEGRTAVVITGEGRKAPTTDQDRAGLYNTLVAYTGRYRVEGDKWITTLDVSANPAWAGTARPDNRMAPGRAHL
jgi:hypothetical protein